jgi:predicted nucleotidyltransferase
MARANFGSSARNKAKQSSQILLGWASIPTTVHMLVEIWGTPVDTLVPTSIQEKPGVEWKYGSELNGHNMRFSVA